MKLPKGFIKDILTELIIHSETSIHIFHRKLIGLLRNKVMAPKVFELVLRVGMSIISTFRDMSATVPNHDAFEIDGQVSTW